MIRLFLLHTRIDTVCKCIDGSLNANMNTYPWGGLCWQPFAWLPLQSQAGMLQGNRLNQPGLKHTYTQT